MAIRYGSGDWPNFNVEPLTDGDFLVVSHPDLVAGRKINCLKDVKDLPWLLESHMMERRALVENEGIDLDQSHLTLLETNGLVLSGVAAKLGITVQPRSLVQHSIDDGSLVELCHLNQQDVAYYMCTLAGRETPALVTFQKWLRSVAELP